VSLQMRMSGLSKVEMYHGWLGGPWKRSEPRRILQSDEPIANAIVRLQSTVIRVAAVVPLTSDMGSPLPTAA
jgi:hypothetical protein